MAKSTRYVLISEKTLLRYERDGSITVMAVEKASRPITRQGAWKMGERARDSQSPRQSLFAPKARQR